MTRALLIVDACVLIDFWHADPSVVALICRHVGQLNVAQGVLAEVRGLDASTAQDAGLRVVQPDFEVLSEAATAGRGLSYQDQQCLILARMHGWTCVTNDGRLRRVCAEDGVDVLWGLELLAQLVEAAGIPAAQAVALAHEMARANRYLTTAILTRFQDRVRGLD